VITLASDHHYLQLREMVAGSLSGKTLTYEQNNSNVTNTEVLRQPTVGECEEDRNLGRKFYELVNYLGNVNEVISDRKIAHDDPLSTNVDYFEADVISYADYYPFGMSMPGREGSIESYRYGYNGMEKDPEVSGEGNSYTTALRQYDPRLGRWKSLDPLKSKYPHMSPYSAFNNNPIFYTDPRGLEGVPGNPNVIYSEQFEKKFGEMIRKVEATDVWFKDAMDEIRFAPNSGNVTVRYMMASEHVLGTSMGTSGGFTLDFKDIARTLQSDMAQRNDPKNAGFFEGDPASAKIWDDYMKKSQDILDAYGYSVEQVLAMETHDIWVFMNDERNCETAEDAYLSMRTYYHESLEHVRRALTETPRIDDHTEAVDYWDNKNLGFWTDQEQWYYEMEKAPETDYTRVPDNSLRHDYTSRLTELFKFGEWEDVGDPTEVYTERVLDDGTTVQIHDGTSQKQIRRNKVGMTEERTKFTPSL
jgi:RHS repeat-associated protein